MDNNLAQAHEQYGRNVDLMQRYLDQGRLSLARRAAARADKWGRRWVATKKLTEEEGVSNGHHGAIRR